MEKVLLQVSGLNISYRRYDGDVTAVSDVAFSLDEGQILAIVGASGAGKSSIALALAGLHDPDRVRVTGEVLFQGEDILGKTEAELDSLRGKSLGMIFQDPRGSLDPTMRVVDQVAEVIRLHRETTTREAVVEARAQLQEAGISQKVIERAPYAHQLSSGLCQRAMIAIALAGDPGLLVADEPTGSLDLTRQAQIISLLQRRVSESRLAMVLITHDLGIAAAIADQLLVLHEGRVIEQGACDNVLSAPRAGYTMELLHAWRDGFTPEGIRDATA